MLPFRIRFRDSSSVKLAHGGWLTTLNACCSSVCVTAGPRKPPEQRGSERAAAMVCCLLSEWCVATSFYQRAANHVFFCPLFYFAKFILPYCLILCCLFAAPTNLKFYLTFVSRSYQGTPLLADFTPESLGDAFAFEGNKYPPGEAGGA